MVDIKGSIEWESSRVLIGKRIFLFCFGQKCMSGRISDFQTTGQSKIYTIWVSFIEPEFFQEDLVIGNCFTINEASNILGKGKVIQIM